MRKTYLLRYSDANLIEDLLEDLIAFLLLVLEIVVHDVVDRIIHHLLLHVHRRALAFEIIHDPLDLREVEPSVHAFHRLFDTKSQPGQHRHWGGVVGV